MGHANALEIEQTIQEDVSALIKKSLNNTANQKSEFAMNRNLRNEQNSQSKRSNDKEKVLSLLNGSKNQNIDENLLEAISKCECLKILDTYITDKLKTSIVKFEDFDVAITIEHSSDGLTIKERKPYVTKKMYECFIGEENECGYFSTAVKYLDEEEREKYRLEIINGLFYQNGELYNSESETMGHTYAKYVMTKEGVIYCYNNHCTGKFHHSSFLSGDPVACAGDIEIMGGMLLSINNDSDHYDPTTEMYKQFINELQKRGVDTNERIL